VKVQYPFLERDLLIAKELHESGYMLIDQLQQLFWPDSKRPQACRLRMKKLTDLGLVRRFELLGAGSGRKNFVYSTGPISPQVLEDHFHIPAKSVDFKPKSREQNISHLQHHLAANALKITIRKAIKNHPTIELDLWEYESTLKIRGGYDRINLPIEGTTKTEKRGVIADSHFVLKISTNQGYRLPHLFPEYDFTNSTLEPTKQEEKSWKQKAQARLIWFNDKTETITENGKTRAVSAFEKRYGSEAARFLWLTQGEVRLQNMIGTVESLTEKNKHFNWFSTYDQITPATFLTGQIWRVATKQEEGLKSLTW